MKTTKTLIALTAALVLHTAAALAAVFTSNTTITSSNTTYEGLEIIVSGCTVTVNGTHAFDRLVVTNGGILTHSPASSGQGGEPPPTDHCSRPDRHGGQFHLSRRRGLRQRRWSGSTDSKQ